MASPPLDGVGATPPARLARRASPFGAKGPAPPGAPPAKPVLFARGVATAPLSGAAPAWAARALMKRPAAQDRHKDYNQCRNVVKGRAAACSPHERSEMRVDFPGFR